MLDEYIPKGILSRVVIIENNSSKRKDYGTDLMENNDENNLHHVIRATSINKSGVLSVCVYTYVNKYR